MRIIAGGVIVQSEWRIMDGYALGLFTISAVKPLALAMGI